MVHVPPCHSEKHASWKEELLLPKTSGPVCCRQPTPWGKRDHSGLHFSPNIWLGLEMTDGKMAVPWKVTNTHQLVISADSSSVKNLLGHIPKPTWPAGHFLCPLFSFYFLKAATIWHQLSQFKCSLHFKEFSLFWHHFLSARNAFLLVWTWTSPLLW